MKVTLEKELVDYMHDHHHDTITLKLIHDLYSGYDVRSKHPSIRYHRPKHVERYNVFNLEDITVFVEKDVQTKNDELKFIDEKILGVHRCHVMGLDLDYAKDYMA